MISSTQKDLQPERDAIDRYIISAGFEPLRSETHAAMGLSSEEVCMRMAEECHLYIGILGFRYGYIPKDSDVSVTEMEYRKARAISPGKILIYMKYTDDDSCIDDEQKRFRTDVEDFRLGYFRHDKFATLNELVFQIKRDIPAWLAQRLDLLERMRKENTILENNLDTLRKNATIWGMRKGLLC